MLRKIGPYILIAIFISAVLVAANAFLPAVFPGYYFSKAHELIVVFGFLFVSIHAVIIWVTTGKPELFAQLFLVQATLKMLFLLAIFLALAKKIPEEKFSLTGIFFMAYLLHTVNEVYWLLRFSKKNSEGNRTSDSPEN